MGTRIKNHHKNATAADRGTPTPTHWQYELLGYGLFKTRIATHEWDGGAERKLCIKAHVTVREE